MKDEDFVFELYRTIRENLKRIINEEFDYSNVKFWGNDIIERVQHLCYLKKKILKGKEIDKKCVSSKR